MLVHFLKQNDKGSQTWSKTNWPFSMESMSWRWGGGGVPAYLPPWFFRTKQAMSATRVRRATAHMVPMNHPWVEKSLDGLLTPENKNAKVNSLFLCNNPHTSLSLKRSREIWWIQSCEDVLTPYLTSHCLRLKPFFERIWSSPKTK